MRRRARHVRKPQKIMAVGASARLVSDIASEHGAFLAGWPVGDQIGRMALLAARGALLGGEMA